MTCQLTDPLARFNEAATLTLEVNYNLLVKEKQFDLNYTSYPFNSLELLN